MTEKALLPKYLYNFLGSSIRMAIVKNLMEVIPIRLSPRLVLVGWLEKMMLEWAQQFNFTINIVSVPGFGNSLPNGTFNGVIGAVQREEADIAVASLSISESRMVAVHFLEWMTTQRTVFICHLPTQLIDQFLIFRVYTWQVYGALLCFVVIAALTLFLVSIESLSLSSSFFIILKTFTYQGGALAEPSGNSGRIILASSSLLVMIIFYSYNGNLTAFLSIPRVVMPPSSVREVNDQGYVASINQGYSQYDLIKNSPSSDFQRMYHNALIKPVDEVITNEKVESLKFTKTVTIMGEAGAVFYITGTAIKNPVTGVKVCHLMMGKEYLSIDYNSFAVKKNSFLKPSFDRIIMRLRGMGIIQDTFNKEFTVQCKYESSRTSGHDSLKTNQLSGLFYVWLVGIGTSLIAFIGEVSYAKYRLRMVANV